ncbi:hypothetical protein PR048_018851 [Dryococelus australis]|uniref:CCHC-type domain-containing protein n=1 Tax=Dryococelus australis TaxID=614101 RepID=A0ABQ9H1Z4_9NEOP|nr:hypothetical protein PR048_018851 [Dryococelus australis]
MVFYIKSCVVRELINVRKTADMSIHKYMSKIQDLNRNICKSRIVFTDQVLSLIFLKGLPMEKYERFVRSLERAKETLGTKLVKVKLLIEERRVNRDAEWRKCLKPQCLEEIISYGHKRFWICYACGKKGNIAKNCAQHRDENKGIGERSADEEAREINKSEASVKEYRVLCVKQPTLKSTSHHMTPHPKIHLKQTCVVGIADGEPLQIRGRGTVLLQMLSTVLYVPNISDNLILVGCVEGLGKSICFEKDCAKIIDGQKAETRLLELEIFTMREH